MATTAKRWTVDEVRALPDDGNRYELVGGELLVTPAPSWVHQEAVAAIFRRLDPWLTAHRLGRLVLAPADVELEPDTIVQPDLFVVPLVEGRGPRRWEEVRRLLLAVEVLSPASARADRLVKRALYRRAGVPEYWLVDLDARLIERARPADERPEILAERLEWRPEASVTPLAIDLPALFAEVLGE